MHLQKRKCTNAPNPHSGVGTEHHACTREKTKFIKTHAFVRTTLGNHSHTHKKKQAKNKSKHNTHERRDRKTQTYPRKKIHRPTYTNARGQETTHAPIKDKAPTHRPTRAIKSKTNHSARACTKTHRKQTKKIRPKRGRAEKRSQQTPQLACLCGSSGFNRSITVATSSVGDAQRTAGNRASLVNV